MKTRFNTVDICTSVREINTSLLGLRVVNIYDIDNRTYLIKLAKPDQKSTILLESGNRIHKTEFEWPKGAFPSGFSMKLRKHLRTRRLESIRQLGVDRIVDLQFGSGEAAYHVIVELYDRGNIVLTDHEYLILNILRPRTDECQDVRFAVREKYPIDIAKQYIESCEESLKKIVDEAKDGDQLKRALNPHLPYGVSLIEHCLLSMGISDTAKIGAGFGRDEDNMAKLYEAMRLADTMLLDFTASPSKGYIIQKMEKRVQITEGESEHMVTYNEFHPYLFKQHEKQSYVEFPDFNTAVDDFYSKLSSQKLDLKVLQQEKSALKKLENVKKDHEKRLDALQKEQTLDAYKAELIEMNADLVDRALTIVRSFIANQISWQDISDIIKEAQAQGDPVAAAIKDLKLDTNHIVLFLSPPYADHGDSDEDDSPKKSKSHGQRVEIDLGLSAYANATKCYDQRRQASSKEQKTIESSTKALKSAKRKTQQTLKDVATVANINKLRKTYWFEKFLWFVSSENYLVVAGRDQQQNEMIWKRYLRPGDVYVHADLHGACSVVVKNTTKLPVGPKTLTEAGVMAVCHSTAWDARIVTSAWWVHPEQVTKTAPSGEYLSTGSFMIRGKKNYLPPCHLVYGFGFMFKLDDDSVLRHQGERKLRLNEETESLVTDGATGDDDDFEELVGSGDEAEGDDTEQAAGDEVEGGEEDVGDSVGDETEPTSPAAEKDVTKESPESSQNGDDVRSESDDDEKEGNDHGDEVAMAPEFPDTTIDVQYIGGEQFKLETQSSVVDEVDNSRAEEAAGQTKDVDSTQKFSRKQRRDEKKSKRSESEQPTTQPTEQPEACESTKKIPSQPQQLPLKRGQKAKMKKMKEKYGDQDDEERQLRMEILMSAGTKKEDKKKKKKVQVQKVKQGPSAANKWRQHRAAKSQILTDESEEPVAAKEEAPDSDEEKQAFLEEEKLINPEDANVLDSLTGCPVADDTLLFAVPVCAPYSTMTNYKYKVKLTPGTTKRGKASKTAFGMFQYDRSATGREKDLLRAVKFLLCWAEQGEDSDGPKIPSSDVLGRLGPGDTSLRQMDALLAASARTGFRSGGSRKVIADLENVRARDGDMRLTVKQYLRLHGKQRLNSRLSYKADSDLSHRWTDGVMPYTFAPKVFSDKEKNDIREAMDLISNFTCIQFREKREGDKNWVIFQDNGSGCNSELGMAGRGAQYMNLDDDGCRWNGLYIHEIGHALGLIHEHQRPDRDEHMKVLWRRVKSDYIHAFSKYANDSVNYYGTEYDPSSIMHYEDIAFSENNEVTIVLREPWKRKYLTRTYFKTLSWTDTKILNDMYKCGARCNKYCPGKAYVDKDCNCVTPDDVYEKLCHDEIQPIKYCYERLLSGSCSSSTRHAAESNFVCRKTCDSCPKYGRDHILQPRYELRTDAWINWFEDDAMCEHWANEQYCRSYRPHWMKRNCRRSCGEWWCKREGIAMDRCEAAFADYFPHGKCKNTLNINDDTECDEAAKRGKCNEAKYKLECADSCQTCGYQLQGDCEDTDADCDARARRGDCDSDDTRLAIETLTRCRKSCNSCGFNTDDCENKMEGDQDNDFVCGKAAIEGKCLTDPQVYKDKCRKACNTCDYGKKGNCENKHGTRSTCYWLGKEGSCRSDSSIGIAKHFCGKDCDNCEYTANPPCEDLHPRCADWDIEECVMNPRFMFVNCKKKCNVCHRFAEGNCENRDLDETCERDAKKGLCEEGYADDSRHRQWCPRSCGVCEAPPLVLNTECRDLAPTNCAWWKKEGLCDSHSSIAILCVKSCGECGKK